MSRNNEDQPPSFSFLDLPAELRNNVYEKAFEERTTIKAGKALAPGILLECKQIHNEAIMIFYETAIFYFIVYHDGVDWYTRLSSKYRDAVAKLRWDGVEELKIHFRLQDVHRPIARHVACWGFESFRESVECRGVTRRQGVMKSSEVLWLKDVSRADEIREEDLSNEVAELEKKKLSKVWVTDCKHDHDTED